MALGACRRASRREQMVANVFERNAFRYRIVE